MEITGKNCVTIKWSNEINNLIDIDPKYIIDDLGRLKKDYLMPIHVNSRKDEIIKFKKGKPIIKKKKRSTPTILYVYCPFCRKLLDRTNIYKNSNHFQINHKRLPLKVIQQLLDVIRLNGLDLYRRVQVLSIFKRSDNQKEKEKLKDIFEGNSIVEINEMFSIRLPRIKFDMEENQEISTLVFDSINKNIVIDYINTLILNDKDENEIIHIESRNSNINVNYCDIFNSLNEKEDEERIISYNEKFFEKVIILSQFLLNGKNNSINEVIDELNEKERLYLFKNIMCYSMATLGCTKRQSDFFNNSLKIYSKLFGIEEHVYISYSSCHRKWLSFLEIIKTNIKQLNKKCECFSLMVDETSQYNVNTIMLIANYKIGNNYYKRLIKLETLNESPTSENILDWINQQLNDYEFDCSKFKGICTDGASSMIKMCAELVNKYSDNNFISIHCFCHRLNIAIQHVINNNNCEIVKSIISWFETSNVLTMFKNYIKPFKINSPPRNCPTRWEYYVNSIDYILKNISTIEEFINQKDIKSQESISKIRTYLIDKTKKI